MISVANLIILIYCFLLNVPNFLKVDFVRFVGHIECPNNCSDCQEGTCRACDDDFALKTITRRRFSKTICVPCGLQLKRNNPALFLRKCVTGKLIAFAVTAKF